MVKSVEDVTPEQWKLIEELKLKCVHEEQTIQHSDESIVNAVKEMWEKLELKEPEVSVFDSPEACIAAYIEKTGKTRQEIINDSYWAIWWRSWVCWYQAAQVLDIELDQDRFNTIKSWADNCPFAIIDEEHPFVSRNPTEVHWRDGVLHNTEGPAVLFADGCCLYAIEGVAINDPKVVLDPASQTLEEMNKEDNEEVKRIRIQQYGWEKYLEEMNASVIDHRFNEVDQRFEALFDTEDFRILVCSCPSSKGRVYAMEVNKECESCEAAQNRLRHETEPKNIILAT